MVKSEVLWEVEVVVEVEVDVKRECDREVKLQFSQRIKTISITACNSCGVAVFFEWSDQQSRAMNLVHCIGLLRWGKWCLVKVCRWARPSE